MPQSTEGFSINELSSRLGHSRGALKRWLSDVEPCGTRNGFPVYSLPDVERAISQSMQRHRVGTTGRERLVNLQAEKLAFQIAVMKGEYSKNEDVDRWVFKMVSAARSVLLAGPPALAPQVVGVSIPEAEQLLKDWVFRALTELHKNPSGESVEPPVANPEPTAGNFSVTEH